MPRLQQVRGHCGAQRCGAWLCSRLSAGNFEFGVGWRLATCLLTNWLCGVHHAATRAGILYISEGNQWSNMVEAWVKRVGRCVLVCHVRMLVNECECRCGRMWCAHALLEPFHCMRTWRSHATHRAPAQQTRAAVLPVTHSAYAAKAKWPDAEVPLRHLRELFAKYVPPTLFEMKKSFTHIVPLGTMNWVTSLLSILEVRMLYMEATCLAMGARPPRVQCQAAACLC